MSLRRQALRGVFWSAVQSGGSNLISMAVILVLVRFLEPKAFGVVELAVAVAAFMEVFLRQGLVQAVVQMANADAEHLDTAFWASVTLGVVLTAAAVLGAGWAGAFYAEPLLVPVVRWISLTVLIGALGHTQQAILQRHFAFKTLAIRSLAGSIGGGVVGIGMAVAGCGVWSLVGHALATASVGTIVLWTASDWRPGLSVSRSALRHITGFGAYVVGVDLVSYFTRWSDTWIVGAFLGPDWLGYYAVAQRFLRMMTQVLTQTLTTVAFPTFSRLQHDPSQMRQAYYTATQMTSLLAFPAFMGVALLAPELTAACFGERWLASVPAMRILAVVGLAQGSIYFSGAVILGLGKPSWHFALALVAAFFQVGVAAALVTPWGLSGVASAGVVRSFIILPLWVVAVRRTIGIDVGEYSRRYAAPLFGSAAMVGIVAVVRWGLASHAGLYVQLGVCIVVGVIAYAVIIRLCAPQAALRAVELSRLAFSGPAEPAHSRHG